MTITKNNDTNLVTNDKFKDKASNTIKILPQDKYCLDPPDGIIKSDIPSENIISLYNKLKRKSSYVVVEYI
jgi:hypothetical protein